MRSAIPAPLMCYRLELCLSLLMFHCTGWGPHQDFVGYLLRTSHVSIHLLENHALPVDLVNHRYQRTEPSEIIQGTAFHICWKDIAGNTHDVGHAQNARCNLDPIECYCRTSPLRRLGNPYGAAKVPPWNARGRMGGEVMNKVQGFEVGLFQQGWSKRWCDPSLLAQAKAVDCGLRQGVLHGS